MLHALKTINPYFSHVVCGEKTFEVRKVDRPFSLGDSIVLQEWIEEPEEDEEYGYTGREWHGEITYLLSEPEFVKKGFIILGIKPKNEVTG